MGLLQGGDQQKPELSLSIRSCLTLTRNLPMALGSDAGFKLVSKHLLFKRLVEVPAMLLFWCLWCVTSLLLHLFIPFQSLRPRSPHLTWDQPEDQLCSSFPREPQP